MTEKELKRLSRAELLELLLMQTRESELLQMKLEAAKQELDARELNLRKAGNLADAVVVINGVMESTQKAAQQYLDNIQQMEQDTRTKCLRMFDDLEQVLVEAQQILTEGRREPVPVPAVFLEEMTSQPQEEPEEERIPPEAASEEERPGGEVHRSAREIWNKASGKLRSLLQRCGLIAASSETDNLTDRQVAYETNQSSQLPGSGTGAEEGTV